MDCTRQKKDTATFRRNDDLRLRLPLDQLPGNLSLVVGLATEAGGRLAGVVCTGGLVEIGRVEVASLPAGRGQPQRREATPAQTGDWLNLRTLWLLENLLPAQSPISNLQSPPHGLRHR